VGDPGQQAVDRPDPRTPERLVTQYITPAGYGNAIRPSRQFLIRVLDGEVRPHIPDARLLNPGLQHQLHRRRACSVKYQPPGNRSAMAAQRARTSSVRK